MGSDTGPGKQSSILGDISKAAQLSKTYTNHCVRTTLVCVMKEQGMSNEEISSVTGHKRSESIQ